MVFVPGDRLGPYEIQAAIGAGGMGEVYRGTDTRLGRTVAVKVLPAALAADPERRHRLEREARIAGSLNHPHICTLYDIGQEPPRLESDASVRYLIMEYLEGATLETRLEKGPLPVEQALAFGIQIADALDKAHRRDVVHRDLKPANIMLTAAGVKLLDFGLATQRDTATGPASQIQTVDRPERITAQGAIIGTLQYMAPEQLEGGEADNRTDIFAFGALLYEMVTGARAFQSASQAGLIGAILRDDPRPISELTPDTPPLLARTISRCLSKDRDDRWQTANDLLFQLRSVAQLPASGGATQDSGASSTDRRARRRERALWAAGIVVSVLAATVGTFLWSRSRSGGLGSPVRNESTTRFTLYPADGTSFYSGYDVPFALSPDGRYIVYVGVSADAAKQLWLRAWDSESAQPMAGTEGANMPFWSPNSQWIGFFADGSLKKVRISGGLPQTVAGGASTFAGASWGAGDVILFSPGLISGIFRVSAQGGAITQVTVPGPANGERGHLWPRFLGDGDHFIYASGSRGGENGGIYVASLGAEAPRIVAQFESESVSALEYVPGYILYVDQNGGLFARPFDEDRLESSGEPIRILDGIPITGPGRAPFSASATGVLAYWPYAVGTPAVLQWFDRDGRTSAAVETPTRYISFRLSPDGRQLVFSRAANDGRADLWVRDLERGTESRLTSDGTSFSAVWSPDGTRIAFSAARRTPPNLFIRNVGATGEDMVVSTTESPDFPLSWSSDRESIVSVLIDPVNRHDLWIWRLQDGKGPVGERLSISSSFNEGQGRVSPDGRWIAYVTDESGQEEVWVAGFPSGENRRQVSVSGGTAPEWGALGAQVFYISRDKQMMATPFNAGEAGTPRALFRIDSVNLDNQAIFPASDVYTTTANGQRFLVAVGVRDPNAPPISVVLNWPALMKQ